jgi:tetratricopeptide (TPR) repeat protein
MQQILYNKNPMKKLIFSPFALASARKKIMLIIIGLVVFNLLLYIGTVRYDFLKDDFRLIVENPRLKDCHSFFSSMTSQFFSFPDFPYLHYWRPMSLFSFFIDYQLWGLNPSGFHLFNILLNAFNALLVFLVFYLLSQQIHYAFLAAFFFSIHPAHVETVSWISGRTDLLASFFIFTAVLFFILFLKKRKLFLYLFAAFFFILGLLSKEIAFLFPLLAAGLIWRMPGPDSPNKKFCGGPGGGFSKEPPGRRRLFQGKFFSRGSFLKRSFVTLPFWVIDVIYITLHHRFSGVGQVVENFSFNDSFLIIKTLGAYTKILLAPFFPAPYFSMYQFDRSHLEYLVYFAAALGILVMIVIHREKYKASIYSLLFLLFLLPVLDPKIVPSYPNLIRFTYIPVLFAGVFFLDTFRFFKSRSLKIVYVVLLSVMGLFWMFSSLRFQIYFKDQNHHYNGLVRYYPEDCSLLLPLALVKAQEGDYKNALEWVNRALEVNDRDRWQEVSEMGGLLKANLLIAAGHPGEGKALAEKILGETRKEDMQYFGYLVLSKYHEKKGEFAAALEMLKRAENIGETAELFFSMALVYTELKDVPQALIYVEKAIALNPAVKKYVEFRHIIQDWQKEDAR